jgi:hypothetical protein
LRRYSLVGLTKNAKGGRCPDIQGSYLVIQYLPTAALVKHIVPDGTPADRTTLADETDLGELLPTVGADLDQNLTSQIRGALTARGVSKRDADAVMADRRELLIHACQKLWGREDLTARKLTARYSMGHRVVPPRLGVRRGDVRKDG